MSGGLALDRECPATTDTAVEFWLQHLSRPKPLRDGCWTRFRPWLGQRILEVGCGIGTYTAELAVGSRRLPPWTWSAVCRRSVTGAWGRHPNVRLICGDATELDRPGPVTKRSTRSSCSMCWSISRDVRVARCAPGGAGRTPHPEGAGDAVAVLADGSGHRPLASIRQGRLDRCGYARRPRGGADLVVQRGPRSRRGGGMAACSAPVASAGAGGFVQSPRRYCAPLDRLARLFCGISLFAVARRPSDLPSF